MEKDNKRKATLDINEEQMMNLMVDGVKKEGLQLPPELPEEPEKETVKEEVKQEELLQSKPVQRERNRTKKNLDEIGRAHV